MLNETFSNVYLVVKFDIAIGPIYMYKFIRPQLFFFENDSFDRAIGSFNKMKNSSMLK